AGGKRRKREGEALRSLFLAPSRNGADRDLVPRERHRLPGSEPQLSPQRVITGLAREELEGRALPGPREDLPVAELRPVEAAAFVDVGPDPRREQGRAVPGEVKEFPEATPDLG